MDRRAERTGITAERLLRELALIGFANMGDYLGMGADGQPCLDLSDLTRDQAAAIREIRIDETGKGRRVRLKLSDKLTALMTMGRHLGKSMTNVEQGGRIDDHAMSPDDARKETIATSIADSHDPGLR